MRVKLLYVILFLAVANVCQAAEKGLSETDRRRISQALSRIVEREVSGGSAKVQSCQIKGRRLRLNVSDGLAYYPFREENVQAMYDTVRELLPQSFAKYRLEIYTDKQPIEELVPLPFRSSFDRRKIRTFTNRSPQPLVRRLSSPVEPVQGLQDRHIALWQSHGRYFDQKENRWRWQRVPLWQTREDLFTQSFVLPYLVPMLEKAGANVLLPRERDIQRTEIIIDRESIDPAARYTERNGHSAWRDGGPGFAMTRHSYMQGENPFREGGCRITETTTDEKRAGEAIWTADIPHRGEYAVYVSYRTFPESTSEAHYTVRHAGGESRFAVNQRMGGGTWIYLGTFRFEAGAEQPVVTLSSRSGSSGRIVAADAVKIGGGYGNIARTVCDSLRLPGTEYLEEVSGFPRYCEGARYWLQWAGFDETVYAPKNGGDDYKEDYMSRAHWVNALMGGSERLPGRPGLAVPIDLALAFHSDAGTRPDDEIVGTLGICCTRDNEGYFEGGVSRYRSRDLTDLVMTQIVQDIRNTWEPDWQRRGLWNRSYYEARVPSAPTMLLELLSHQNFADMRYGHDPRFKFLVARAVYKGILRHIATQYDYTPIVQPLPVADFSVELSPEGVAHLRWRPVEDRLEITAHPTGYVVYTAVDDGDFDNGTRVADPEWTFEQQPGRLYRYRVSACNEGGESFPSETLAACAAPDAKGTVLVVNGFTRICAAPSYSIEGEAGFTEDGGVADRYDLSHVGRQRIYDRTRYADENPETALGSCDTDREAEVVVGNTFDYPALHGRSIVRSGYSFCSASVGALTGGSFSADSYKVIDLILGKQRSTLMGRGLQGYEFEAFPIRLQQFLRDYAAGGGALFVSGCYVASDLWESENSSDADRNFAREVLHYEYAGGRAARTGKIRGTSARLPIGECRIRQEPAPEGYAANAPDALGAVGAGAFPAARYTENGQTAGVACDGPAGRTVVLGFPFETISSEAERDRMMNRLLVFLTNAGQTEN